ncbi:MAG: sulfate ABC transporter ATP-binding protein [Planctomycetaceae bacterium]|nr:sulfate ABC transporter ATP-binding protein [Planctomycetaceae bacterium]
MSIEVRNISKSFGNFTALRDVSLQVHDGELLALLGPSGSGKTTLLRIISGLEVPNPNPSSDILFHGQSVVDRPVRHREVGFVFQHYALFRHMSVADNIGFGLRMRPRATRPSKSEIRDRVGKLLKLIQLEGFGDRFPSQLSGGQRQRVALARALAVEPKVLLLDEPFGALDAKVRQGLRTWLRRLHDEIHLTSVLVTHDQEEALEVADRVVVMNQSRIEQIGTPDEVFHHPKTPFVMEFLGQVNVFHGRVTKGKIELDDPFTTEQHEPHNNSNPQAIYARPHELDIQRELTNGEGIAAKVRRLHLAGPIARVILEAENGGHVQVHLSLERFYELALQPGVAAYVVPKSGRVFEGASKTILG